MTATFSVKDYEKFQHYSNRTPPWIKLYNALLDNYEYSQLPDASKAHLIAIWLLASRSKNIMPLDAKWVATRISATDPVNLNVLRDAGFIVFNQDCSNTLASSKQNACLEREEEREEERDIMSAFADPSKSEPKSESRKSPYPEAFETFWREYPTDPLMSKKKTYDQWKRLTEADKIAARAAIPGFRSHCSKNPTYRPVHAQRFLSERRFDGFSASRTLDIDPQRLAELSDRTDKILKRGKYAEALQ